MAEAVRLLTKWFDGVERPLDACIAWASAQRRKTGQAFVIISTEIPVKDSRGQVLSVVRRYGAIDAEAGLRQFAKSPVPHAHEVIVPGPVRLYADIDVAQDDSARESAPELYQQFVDTLVDCVEEELGLSCEVLTLDASAGKFSRHLVVDMWVCCMLPRIPFSLTL